MDTAYTGTLSLPAELSMRAAKRHLPYICGLIVFPFIQTLNIPPRKTKLVAVLTLHVRFFSAKPARDTKLMHPPPNLTRWLTLTRFTRLTRLWTGCRSVNSTCTHPNGPVPPFQATDQASISLSSTIRIFSSTVRVPTTRTSPPAPPNSDKYREELLVERVSLPCFQTLSSASFGSSSCASFLFSLLLHRPST